MVQAYKFSRFFEIEMAVRIFKEIGYRQHYIGVIYIMSLLEAITAGVSLTMLIPIVETFTGASGAIWYTQYLPDFITSSPANALLSFGIIILSKWLFSLVFLFFSVYFCEDLRQKWQVDATQRVLYAKFDDYKRTARGVTLENTTRIPDFASMFVIRFLNYITQLTMLIFVFVTICAVSWLAGLGIVVLGVFGWLLVGRIFFRFSQFLGVKNTKLNRRLSGQVISSISGMKEIKTLHIEKYTLKLISHLIGFIRNNRVIKKLLVKAPSMVTEFLVGLGVVGVGLYSLMGQFDLKPHLPLMVFLLGSVMQVLKTAANVASERSLCLARLYAYDEMIKSLGGSYPVEDISAGENVTFTDNSRIEFRNVSFAYPVDSKAEAADSSPVLENINISFPLSRRIALLGASGSGKTTMFDLLTRLYDPDDGQILIDGKDIRALSLADWRQHIGYVPQEPTLFDGTIRDNILLGRCEIDDPAIMKLCAMAQISDVIDALPKKLDTYLHDMGQILSGGQKRRLSIVRALVAEPKLLVIDEATNALDEAMELELLTSLRGLEGMGVFIITHRSSTIKSVEQVIHISNRTCKTVDLDQVDKLNFSSS